MKNLRAKDRAISLHGVSLMRVPAAVAAMVLLSGCATTGSVDSAAAKNRRVDPAAADSQPQTSATGSINHEDERDSAPRNEFVLNKSDGATAAQGGTASQIKATTTEAAMKFIVLNKDKGPIEGIVISLTAPDGTKYYTKETDTTGYAEVLVPVGQKYQLVYLSLGRQDIAANVSVNNDPNQNIKLTLRYKSAPPPTKGTGAPPFVLSGVTFDTGKATIRPESFSRLDSVLEYMTHKPSSRIQISGHTDNVGNPKTNKTLSEKRARACREYLMAKGVDGGRIEAVGYGDERPIASNDSDEGRQKNRRIEAVEL